MNQSKAFITSFVFAGLAMLLVYFYVSEKENTIKSDFGNEVAVVVAAQDINEFEQIQAKMLTSLVVPKKFVQPGSNSDSKTFEGAVASAPIRKGEQVLLTKVLLKGAETGLASQVAINHRALSLPISDTTGVTRLIKPGDRVDIVSNVTYQASGGGGQESEVKTLLQNVHVLAVGELIQNSVPSAFEEDPLTGNKRVVNLRGSRAFSTITVEVEPLNAQMLIYLMGLGSELFLTLRNPVDRVVAAIPTTTVDEVLGPTSKKAEKDRRGLIQATPQRAPSSVSAPVMNPWTSGGGAFAK